VISRRTYCPFYADCPFFTEIGYDALHGSQSLARHFQARFTRAKKSSCDFTGIFSRRRATIDEGTGTLGQVFHFVEDPIMRHFQSINFGRSWHVQLWRLSALSALLTASVFAQQPNPAQPQLDPFKLPTTPQATPQPAPSITGDAITSEGAANPFSAGILPAPQGTVTPPAAGNAAAEPAPTAATADLKWRYKRHNGQWWYWLPENRWVIWNNDKWEDYNAATYRVPASAATSGTVIYAQPYNTAVPQTVYRGYNAAPYVGGYSYTPYSRATRATIAAAAELASAWGANRFMIQAIMVPVITIQGITVLGIIIRGIPVTVLVRLAPDIIVPATMAAVTRAEG